MEEKTALILMLAAIYIPSAVMRSTSIANLRATVRKERETNKRSRRIENEGRLIHLSLSLSDWFSPGGVRFSRDLSHHSTWCLHLVPRLSWLPLSGGFWRHVATISSIRLFLHSISCCWSRRILFQEGSLLQAYRSPCAHWRGQNGTFLFLS